MDLVLRGTDCRSAAVDCLGLSVVITWFGEGCFSIYLDSAAICIRQASIVIIVLTSTHAVSVSAGRLHFPVLTKAMTGVIRECVTSLSMALQCE